MFCLSKSLRPFNFIRHNFARARPLSLPAKKTRLTLHVSSVENLKYQLGQFLPKDDSKGGKEEWSKSVKCVPKSVKFHLQGM